MKIKNFLIFLIFILLILSFLFFQEKARNAFYFISSPIQGFSWNLGRSASSFRELGFKEEKKELEIENQKLLNDLVELENIKKENQKLREALGIELNKSFNLELVQIFGKDFSQDVILINKGKNNGIEKGFPLINEQKVLFGRVDRVYENFSSVILISNQGNVFDIEIKNKEVFALAKGKGNLGLFIDLIPPEVKINKGDVVTTSAMNNSFPRDLLVGKINKVIKEDIKSFQKAEIDPFFNIKTTNKLFVVLDF